MASRIADAEDLFAELEGRSLRWEALLVSHGQLLLAVDGGETELLFVDTAFVKGPLRMDRVRVRVATSRETSALRARLGSHLAFGLERADHAIIDCEQGSTEIWARGLAIVPVGEGRKRLNLVSPGGQPSTG
jgi:hypothetical protein